MIRINLPAFANDGLANEAHIQQRHFYKKNIGESLFDTYSKYAKRNRIGSFSFANITEEIMYSQDSDAFLEAGLARGEQIAKTVENLLSAMKSGATIEERLLASGKIYEIAQSYTMANMAYEKAMTEGQLLDEVRLRSAIVFLKSREPRRALVIINGLVNSSPQFVFQDISGRRHSVYTALGDALRENCDFEGAESAYRQALTQVPDDEYTAGHLAALLTEKGNIDEAMTLVKPLIGDDRFTELQSTISLLGNSTTQLPAITSIVRNSLFISRPQV